MKPSDRLLVGLLGACLLLASWVDATTHLEWWHVMVAWAGAVAVGAAVWPKRKQYGWKACPECGSEGTIAFVNDPGDWVVTCHDYFWTLTDADMAALMDAVTDEVQ